MKTLKQYLKDFLINIQPILEDVKLEEQTEVVTETIESVEPIAEATAEVIESNEVTEIVTEVTELKSQLEAISKERDELSAKLALVEKEIDEVNEGKLLLSQELEVIKKQYDNSLNINLKSQTGQLSQADLVKKMLKNNKSII